MRMLFRSVLSLMVAAVVLAGCGELDSGGLVARGLVLDSQHQHRLGDYRALYSAALAGGHAVVSAGTPQGLNGVALASYWVGSGQAYAINSLALSLSPGLPGYDDLPVSINPNKLIEIVTANN